MTSTILYDGLNLSLSSGTGIATYTRNLARAAQEAGHRTEIAYAMSDPVPSDPTLREVALFEERRRALTREERISNWIASRLGRFGNLPLYAVEPSGTVIVPAAEQGPPAASRLQVGRQIFERARLNFAACGRFATLRPATPPDLAHFTCATPLRVAGVPNVYTIHDLVPIRLPYATRDNKRRFYAMHREIARTADHIVTVSEASRQDIVRCLGVREDRVTNTYQTVTVPETLLAKDEGTITDELYGLYGLERGRYFLFYGAIEPKKNVRRLLEAFLSTGQNLQLVLVSSSGWQNEAELEIIDHPWFGRSGLGTARVRPKLKRIAYAPYGLLVSLIRGARAVLFPSLYEGFGLPVLEAMMLGTPVLTANVASLPEVAGEAALMVDPTDVEAIRRGIVALASDDDLCRDLGVRGLAQAAKFSPARYRERVATLYTGLGLPAEPMTITAKPAQPTVVRRTAGIAAEPSDIAQR